MALSSRMRLRLRQAGFINITGLKKCFGGHVGDGLRWMDVGMYYSIHIKFPYKSSGGRYDDDESFVFLPVDMFITEGGEVWVAPQYTFSLRVINRLVDFIRKITRKNQPANCSLERVSLDIEDFLRAANPQMGWALDLKAAEPIKEPTRS